MSEQIDIAEPKLARAPWRAIAVTLAVLLVCWYCFPAAVAGWVEDHCEDENAWCVALQTVADSVDTASRSVGVPGIFETWRDEIRAALGVDSY
ncbi:MAG: hypothetical protein ABI398_08535 [Devosia sp.]